MQRTCCCPRGVATGHRHVVAPANSRTQSGPLIAHAGAGEGGDFDCSLEKGQPKGGDEEEEQSVGEEPVPATLAPKLQNHTQKEQRRQPQQSMPLVHPTPSRTLLAKCSHQAPILLRDEGLRHTRYTVTQACTLPVILTVTMGQPSSRRSHLHRCSSQTAAVARTSSSRRRGALAVDPGPVSQPSHSLPSQVKARHTTSQTTGCVCVSIAMSPYVPLFCFPRMVQSSKCRSDRNGWAGPGRRRDANQRHVAGVVWCRRLADNSLGFLRNMMRVRFLASASQPRSLIHQQFRRASAVQVSPHPLAVVTLTADR
jgi:hypothetical protein